MLLQHCTWQDVDAYLERSKGVVVPMGDGALVEFRKAGPPV